MIKYLSLFFLLSIWACENDSEVQSSKGLAQAQIDSLAKQILDFPNQTQISIGVIKDGTVHFVGLKNEKGKAQVVNNHKSIFEIGSITKVFTNTLLAQLVLENKLELEDAINEYTPILFQGGTTISFVDLANHTSGLPRLPSNIAVGRSAENPYQHYGENQLKAYLTKELESSIRVRGNYLYSNLGTGLLGYILTGIEGQSYESLLHSIIFSKYKMSHSTTIRKKIEPLLVKGLNEAGNEVLNWDLSVMVGAGGVLSSTQDLSKFALAHFDTADEVLALTRQPTYTVDHISDIGLGWEIIKRRSGAIWYKHNGRTGGYTSAMILDVQQKNGIILLSNISGFSSQNNLIDDWAFDLMKQIEQPTNK